jgi:hypothetical protein
MRIKMTDDEKKMELAMKVSTLVSKTCIHLEISPYDAIEVLAKSMTVLAITSAKDGREADVVLDILAMVWELGTDMIEKKRGEGDDESSVQRSH